MLSIASAQKLTVESMKAAPYDISASQYERKDLNQQPCALVKVQLAGIGAEFEGNVIGKSEYKTGEYWVYMSEQSYMLTVKHPNFVPLAVNFRDYGIKGVEQKVTYVLTLNIPQAGAQPLDDGMRYLLMSVEPANATVYVNDQLQQVQNGTLTMLLPMGEYSYRVEAPAYEPKSGMFNIGNEKLSLPVKLQSNMATLSVSTATNGTQIYINDQLRGTSSWSGQLPAGTYRVEGRLTGYRNYRQNITLSQRASQQVNIPELQAITGAINVNYQPANAEIWIDGKKAGNSPDIFRGIVVGSHNVEIRANGYSAHKEQIVVKEGVAVTLSGNLTKVSETISHNEFTAKQMIDNALGFLPISEFKNKTLKETFSYVSETYPNYKAEYNDTGRNIHIYVSSKGSYTPRFHDLGLDYVFVYWDSKFKEITSFEYNFMMSNNASNIMDILVKELNQLGCNMKFVGSDGYSSSIYKGKLDERNIIVKLDKTYRKFLSLEIKYWE